MITDYLTDQWNKGILTTPNYIRALQYHALKLESLKVFNTCDNCINIEFCAILKNLSHVGYIIDSKVFGCNFYTKKDQQ